MPLPAPPLNPSRVTMCPSNFHFRVRIAILAATLYCGSGLLAAPPKAIRVEPLGVAPGATSEIVIHGTDLANTTDLLSSLSVANPQTSIELLHQTDEATGPAESMLASGKQPAGAIIVEAEDYSRGKYRRAGIFILNGDFSPNYAEYDIEVTAAGSYQLELNYAAGGSRPVKLFLNGKLLTDEAAGGVTGGFGDGDTKWMVEGVVPLRAGKNVLRLERPGGTPHFDKVGLVPTDQPVTQFSSHKASDRVAPLRAAVGKSCPVGIYAVRVATADGISNPLLFMVDDLPTLISLRETHSMESAQPIELPVAIDGVTESGQSDFFQFSGTKGDWVSVEAVATRLGTKLDPVIRVLNQTGRELAFADDSPSLAGDCRLRIQLPETGAYFVAIEDSSLGGSSAHQYRLRIGNFPLLTGTVPLARGRSQPATVRPIGAGVQFQNANQRLNWSAGWTGTIPVSLRRGDSGGSGFTRVVASELQQFGYSNQQDITPAEIPGGLSGVLDEDQAVHRFRFAAKKGERLVLSDRSRELGTATMLGLAIRSESGKLLGENRRAGTAGGTLNVQIPGDGMYDAEISDITRRSGPEFVYYAELRRSVPDFQLTLDAASVILPQNGYAIVKVSASRKGYNGPIKLRVRGKDGALTVSNEVIPEKKKDTRLKVYLPRDMDPGQTLSLQIIGTAEASDSDAEEKPLERIASTLTFLRKGMPQTPHPPSELQHQLAAVVGPAIPDFFALSLDEGAVFFPRHVGEVYFTVRVKHRTKGFKAPVILRVEGLPDGFRASGGERAVSRSDDNEYRFQLNGPSEMDAGVSEFRIIGEASFKGQTKEVTLAKLPLRIIEPLIITAQVAGKVRAGAKQTINVKARRFVPRAGGDMKAITLKLHGAPAGFALSKAGVIAAAKKDAKVEIQVAANVKPGTYDLILQAATQVAGHDVTVSSAPFQVIVASP
jgi:hypothetical protein